jgi:hypothetical protein
VECVPGVDTRIPKICSYGAPVETYENRMTIQQL